VIGAGKDEQHIGVVATNSGQEYELPHWQVDCGHCVFKDGAWKLTSQL